MIAIASVRGLSSLIILLTCISFHITKCLCFIGTQSSTTFSNHLVVDKSRSHLFQSTEASEFNAGSHEELLYALGVNLGRQLDDIRPLVAGSAELNNMAKGIIDVVLGRLDEPSQANLLMKRKDDINELLMSRSNNLKNQLMEAGRSMLEEMKKIDESIVLPSGTVLHPLEPGPSGTFGDGTRPTAASSVKVHYHGTLPDGSTFDTTSGGEPATFALGQIIPGWKEGLQKICEGETVMFGIPPEAGYGDEGSPDGRVPGGATLFFKVQLLEVLSAGVGGTPKLLGANGQPMDSGGSGGLLGADGRPMGS